MHHHGVIMAKANEKQQNLSMDDEQRNKIKQTMFAVQTYLINCLNVKREKKGH